MSRVREALLIAHRRAAEVLVEWECRERMEAQHATYIDPYALAASADIPVIRRKMAKLLGAYLSEPRPGILVNSDRPRGLVTWTVGHELGHHFLNHGAMQDGQDTVDVTASNAVRERQANHFAFGLMAPKWLVKLNIQRLGMTSRDQLAAPLWVYQLSLRLGLSYAATRFALVELKLLKPSDLARFPSLKPADIKRGLLGPELSKEFDVRNDVWLLVDGDVGHVINGSSHDRFLWHRPSNGSLGYSWTLAEADMAEFDLHFALPQHLSPEGEVVVGSADHALPAVKSSEPGVAESDDVARQLTLEERQPWLSDQPPESAVTLEVLMQQSGLGLTAPSRRVHIQAVDTLQ